jgi:aminoglycoside/choline kinase family phosphotransferase
MLLAVKDFVYSFLRDRGVDLDGVSFQPLRGDGSKRAFWRITLPLPESCFIAMVNPPNDHASNRENFAYLMIGKHLHKKGIPVPEIYSSNLKYGWFIMEDMGRTSLQDLVSSINDTLPIYEELLEHLFRLQIAGVDDFDPAWCSQTQRYDRNVMRGYEANYFRDAFLRLYLGLKDEWPELEVPFNHLSETASKADGDFLLHRDFQSRNIMISKGNIGIIDWQGARLGPLGYDLASLLIDPYSNLSSQNKASLYERYLLMIKENNVELIESFKRYYPYLAIQRNLQILGAFSYLTKTMKKPFFETYIPTALQTLHNLLHEVNDPELCPLRDLVKDINPL